MVYEHFGGKEGLYAVVVDREMRAAARRDHRRARPPARPRELLEQAALALLDYIEEATDGFRILVRDSPVAQPTGTFAALSATSPARSSTSWPTSSSAAASTRSCAELYAQMLVGMVALTGQWWLEARKPKKREVAAHLVNLAWNGLSGLEKKPTLTPAAPDGDAGGELRRGRPASLAAWRRERPDLDVAPLEVLSRVTRLARHLDRARGAAFAAHGLDVWEFDVLAALRRAGAPYAAVPGPAARRDPGHQRHDDQPDRPAGAARAACAGARTRPTGATCSSRLTENGQELVDPALDDLLDRERALLAELGAADADDARRRRCAAWSRPFDDQD